MPGATMRGMANSFLVGFMGAGKTAIGQELARILCFRFVDLDDALVERFGASIREVFESRGEATFRREESLLLERVACSPRSVVATGGGTFCSARNRHVIHSAGGYSVFLDVPWSVILRRLPGKNFDRPRFVDPEQARQLYESRRATYLLADTSLSLDGDEPPDQVAQRIASLLPEVA